MESLKTLELDACLTVSYLSDNPEHEVIVSVIIKSTLHDH